MRPRAAAQPAVPAALRTLVACLPDERPAALVVQLVLWNPARASTIESVDAPRLATGRKPGWPKGKPRGPRRAKAAEPATAAAVESAAIPGPVAAPSTSTSTSTSGAKRAARRQRENAARRAQRAAARRAKAGNGGTADANGNVEIETAQTFWRHAEQLLPKTPWQAVARALELNDAVCLDAYRAKTVPPNIRPDEVERFLNLPGPPAP